MTENHQSPVIPAAKKIIMTSTTKQTTKHLQYFQWGSFVNGYWFALLVDLFDQSEVLTDFFGFKAN